MTRVLDSLPGVASFRRASILSDGQFFSVLDDGRETPIQVIRHGIRGTQNVANSKKGDKQEVAQIQMTESAKTDISASQFGVRFSIRFLPLAEALDSCAGKNSDALREQFLDFVEQCEDSEGLQEVGRRFARNILNARWLWRNRSISDDIKVSVEGPGAIVTGFDAFSSSLNHFDGYSSDEVSLGKAIAACMAGEGGGFFNVEAVVNLGFKGSVEVYPTQNYIQDKPTGFARPLYKLGNAEPAIGEGGPILGFKDIRKMGIAALRDQKIGNAIRTIDTWYPNAELNDSLPISVEPEGANIDKMTFFRGKKSHSSAFDLALRLGELDSNSPDGMFMMAALARGGVYSGGNDK